MTPTPEQIALAIKLRADGVQRSAVLHQTGLTKHCFDALLTQGVIPRKVNVPTLRAAPKEFARYWQDNSLEACEARFGASYHTVKRWARELGLSRDPGVTLASLRGVKPVPRKPNRYLTTARAPISQAVMDEAGRAAEYLRPDYRPVYRCDEEGRQNPAGRMYRCGTRLFTPNQVIERAAEVKARRERMRAA
jgi:hypothetical protein